MPAPVIPPLPPAPNVADPGTFATRASAFAAAQASFRAATNSVAIYLNTLALATGPGLFRAGSAENPSIRRDGGSAGVFFPGIHAVAIATNGAARVWVDSAGSVVYPQAIAGTMEVRPSKLSNYGPSGIRFRMTGAGGTGGILQVSSGDGDWIAVDPTLRRIVSSGVLEFFLNLGTSQTNNPAARIDPVGEAVPNALTVMTREKADARYVRHDTIFNRGTPGFMRVSGTTGFTAGSTVAGSSLSWSNAAGTSGASPSGTWECRGHVVASGTAQERTTFWVRIA